MTCGLYPCPDCPNRGGPRVGSRGNPLSPFVIIGESPGKQELLDKEKRPFVGPSGKVLDHSTRSLPVEPYYINAMMCYPGTSEDKDEDTLQQACQVCRHHVLDELQKAPRKVILALGTAAVWSITGDYSLKITQQRGKLLPTDLAEVGVVATVHPAFLMRDGKGVSAQQYFRDVSYAVDLFNGKPPKQPPDTHFEVVDTYTELRSIARLFKNYAHEVAADIETSDLQPLRGRILCITLAISPTFVYVIPEHLVKYAGMLFQDDITYIWHNGQFDIKWLWQNGIPQARVDEDTILLSYALDEKGGIHSLDIVANDWLGSPNWEAELRKYLPKRDSSYELVPKDVLHKYAALDTANTLGCYYILRDLVRTNKHLEKLYTQLLIPATNFLARVESHGLYVDGQKVDENEVEYLAEIKRIGDEIVAIGKQFPDSNYTDKLPNSHTQLKRLIYDDLGIAMWRRKRSTDKKVIDHLKPHPVLKLLTSYRKIAKEYGTYVKAIRRHTLKDNRVHSSISLFKTRTGRLASNEPNVQNVPRNPKIRGQYIAPPGRRYIEVDLNQAELRVLATLSGDVELCKIYLTAGMSLHDEVRATIWGYPKDYSSRELATQLAKFRLTENSRYDENGKDLLIAEQKMRAKNVNFGVVYGITAAGLAEQTDSSVQDAQTWIDAWFRKFPLAHKFIEACKMAPFKSQTLITTFGRHKRPGIVSQEKAIDIMNEFANFPMQSPASDCTLYAGISLESQLREEYDTYVCNLIHDALLLDAPDNDDICVSVKKLTIARMQEVPRLWGFKKIPFVAEAKEGYRWGSLKG